jgi:hypothetical protein
VSMKSFTATRPVAAGDGRRLASWSLSAGAVALKVQFCNGTAAAPMFEIQVPVNASSSMSYPSPPVFPLGCHLELISGTLNRGEIDV